MAKINEADLKNWQDGETMKAQDYKMERSMIVTALNDEADKGANQYTKAEVDTKLGTKTDVSGNHTGTWQGNAPTYFTNDAQTKATTAETNAKTYADTKSADERTYADSKLALKTDNTGNHVGTWQGLNASDLSSGAVATNINDHKADHNNPHVVTTAQVNQTLAPQASTVAGSAYPLGITTFLTDTVTGYPTAQGSVIATKNHADYVSQLFFESGAESDFGQAHFRVWTTAKGWGAWKKFGYIASNILDSPKVRAGATRNFVRSQLGDWGMHMQDSDIIGLNALVFLDTDETHEGILFPKTGKTYSVNANDYDRVSALDGNLQLNGVSLFNSFSLTTDIYVNTATGNDSTGKGTSANPYKTIQKACDTIARVSNNYYNIRVAAGTYAEEVKVKGVFANGIEIMMDGTAPTATSATTGLNVLSMTFTDVQAFIRINDFDFYNSSTVTAGALVRFTRTPFSIVNNCRFDSDTKTGAAIHSVYFESSKGEVKASYFSTQYVMMRATGGSSALWYSNNASGTASTYGLSVSASEIFKQATTNITATTVEYKTNGGQTF